MTRISDSGLSVAVVGATGQVGTVMREILAERASRSASCACSRPARSAGTSVEFAGRPSIDRGCRDRRPTGIDIALFSAGATGSRAHAPRFAEAGAT
jgi:aspartate-semialdehyde dehydrogenase